MTHDRLFVLPLSICKYCWSRKILSVVFIEINFPPPPTLCLSLSLVYLFFHNFSYVFIIISDAMLWKLIELINWLSMYKHLFFRSWKIPSFPVFYPFRYDGRDIRETLDDVENCVCLTRQTVLIGADFCVHTLCLCYALIKKNRVRNLPQLELSVLWMFEQSFYSSNSLKRNSKISKAVLLIWLIWFRFRFRGSNTNEFKLHQKKNLYKYIPSHGDTTKCKFIIHSLSLIQEMEKAAQ